MKKIFSMLIAGALSASAFATDCMVRQTVNPKGGHQTVLPGFSAQKIEGKKTVRGARKADGSTSLDGTWTFTVMDWYFEESIVDTKELTYIATVSADNIITFKNSGNGERDLVGTIYPDDQKITFSKKYLGREGDYYVFQDPFIYKYDDRTGAPIGQEYQPIDAYYNVEGDMLVFNGDYYGIFWNTYKSSTGETGYNGPLAGYDFILAQQPIQGSWTSIGNARFVDGWILPGFGVNQFENEYEVPMEQNSLNQNLYRLVNPYKYGPTAEVNEHKGTGYIIFDISDPEHVVFKCANAGFKLAQAGISNFACYNYLSIMYFLNLDMTIPELVQFFDTKGPIPYSTYTEGVLKVDGKLDNGTPDARFGYSNGLLGGYYWTDENTNAPVDMTAIIYFPESGVEAIGADFEGVTEYFDLLGVRIANPQKGQLVIKREGGKTVKEIIR